MIGTKVAILVDLVRENVDAFNQAVEEILNSMGGRLIHREISHYPIRLQRAEDIMYPPAHTPSSQRSGAVKNENRSEDARAGMACGTTPGRSTSVRREWGDTGDQRGCVDYGRDLGHGSRDRPRRVDADVRGRVGRLRQRKHGPHRASSQDARTHPLERGRVARPRLRVPPGTHGRAQVKRTDHPLTTEQSVVSGSTFFLDA